MFRGKLGWMETLVERKGFYAYDYAIGPSQNHLLLRSGNHSDALINFRKIIPNNALLNEVASDLVEKYMHGHGDIGAIDIVVGPQTGATKLAEFISLEIGSQRGRPCAFLSPSKSKDAQGNDIMVFATDEVDRLKGKNVLHCEDVTTTVGSVQRSADAVLAAGGIIHPGLLAFANRGKVKEWAGWPITSLISEEFNMWAPEKCPLCDAGSVAMEAPKDDENWKLLTGSN